MRAVCCALMLFCFTPAHAQPWRTLEGAIAQYQGNALVRLAPKFALARVNYPPKRIALLGIKDARRLELWADDGHGYRHVHDFPILHASGVSGPKLREGDLQVPEGIYQLTAFNPNSKFHLSLRVDYPNDFDRMMAKHDSRERLGSDIYIHGKAHSRGCLAMGDSAIEELFVLVNAVGLGNSELIIAPSDPRRGEALPIYDNQPLWTARLYRKIERAFAPFSRDYF